MGLQVIRHAMQPYPESVSEQEAQVARILAGQAGPAIIFTEHPPVYTVGTSGNEADVLQREADGKKIDVFPSGRGGEVTYHGPGQLVCYVLADLRREQDLHRHVWRLEEMVIRMLAGFGIKAGRSKLGIGVWVGEGKIAAVGVRCRKWVAYHGIALNINPNLKHFSGIVPCGMKDASATSMQALGVSISRQDVEQALMPYAQSLFADNRRQG